VNETAVGPLLPSASMKVAYQGEPGAYSERAVASLFPDAEPLPCDTVRLVFSRVTSGEAAFGVVPLENSQAGSVNETYELLLHTNLLQIVGEAVVRVDHALLGKPGARLEEIRRAHSHWQALAQCEEFLSSLRIEPIPAHDTAGAARVVAELGGAEDAAIASVEAGTRAGLAVLAERIQTEKENFTKFAVIGTDDPHLGPNDKTSLVMAVLDEPGSLLGALRPFAERGINMHKLESRPRRGKPFEYVMYVDVMAARDDPRLVQALDEMTTHTSMVRVLGSYRAAVEPA
jgi:prephenate dehydratase